VTPSRSAEEQLERLRAGHQRGAACARRELAEPGERQQQRDQYEHTAACDFERSPAHPPGSAARPCGRVRARRAWLSGGRADKGSSGQWAVAGAALASTVSALVPRSNSAAAITAPAAKIAVAQANAVVSPRTAACAISSLVGWV
jgi:hypothetical protein